MNDLSRAKREIPTHREPSGPSGNAVQNFTASEHASFTGKAKIFVRHFQQVGIGHGAILNARLLAWCDEIIPDIDFDRPECGDFVSNTHSKRVHLQFMKFDSRLPERLANICCVQHGNPPTPRSCQGLSSASLV